MKEYIGTKLVRAEPDLRIQSAGGNVTYERLANHPVTMPTDTVDAGYNVHYPDGYRSWCPQDVFEAACRPTDVAKEAFGGEKVPYGAYIAMKTAQGNVVPWLASQTDMLADDWYIVG